MSIVIAGAALYVCTLAGGLSGCSTAPNFTVEQSAKAMVGAAVGVGEGVGVGTTGVGVASRGQRRARAVDADGDRDDRRHDDDAGSEHQWKAILTAGRDAHRVTPCFPRASLPRPARDR